jgi:hypothetical protein
VPLLLVVEALPQDDWQIPPQYTPECVVSPQQVLHTDGSQRSMGQSQLLVV